MIGRIKTAASFYDSILHAFDGKEDASQFWHLDQTAEEKEGEAIVGILDYNNCFDQNATHLAHQFEMVRQNNTRVEKPVFEISLRPAPEDILSVDQFTEIGHQCARHFDLQDRQYVLVLHKFPDKQYLLMVANRVDFDGKVVKDSFSCRRIQQFCRAIEKEYHLREVLSARAFLPKELRDLPRNNIRNEKLQKLIEITLSQVNSLYAFEIQMGVQGYKVITGRGIVFIDEKQVKIKGSSVGYSLSKIEQIFQLRRNPLL
jgi:hypothetical protein